VDTPRVIDKSCGELPPIAADKNGAVRKSLTLIRESGTHLAYLDRIRLLFQEVSETGGLQRQMLVAWR
jgi:hypothetical protein